MSNGLKTENQTNVASPDRREALKAIAKYSASVAGASTVILSASASVSQASVSGQAGGGACTNQNPGNGKCVGNAPFDGERGQVPSGRP